MAKRTGVLGPFSLAYRAGVEQGLQRALDLSDAAILKDRDILYGAMIQAGVDRLAVATASEAIRPTSPILRERIQVSKDVAKHWLDGFELVNHAFRSGEGGENSDKSSVEIFLVELLCAARARKAMLCLSGIPTQQQVASLPPELALPLGTLVAQLQRLEPHLPAIKMALDAKHLDRFEYVLNSTAFVDYEGASALLEDASVDSNEALVRVRSSSQRLLERNGELLRPKPSSVALMSITAKLIDVIFGALPGKLANLAVDLLRPLAEDRARVVIYDFSDIGFITGWPGDRQTRR
jgi:hypothetical protein